MASRSFEYITSPFENVFSFLGSLPQGHEKAVKHALYNALALFLLIISSAAGWGLFIILGPFIKPLVWALLCGSVLHPFKHSLATVLQSWLQTLESSSTLLLFGVLMVPVNIIDDISEKIGGQLFKHMKTLAVIVVTAVLLHVFYFYTPHVFICLIWRLGLFSNAALLCFIGHISTSVVSSEFHYEFIIYWMNGSILKQTFRNVVIAATFKNAWKIWRKVCIKILVQPQNL